MSAPRGAAVSSAGATGGSTERKPGTYRLMLSGTLALGIILMLLIEQYAAAGSGGGGGVASSVRGAWSLLQSQLKTHGSNRFGDKVIVVARYKEDSSWVDTYFNDFPHVVITPALPGSSHTTEHNKGNEAGPFIKYILDNYDRLPAHLAFVHGHRISHHTYQLDIVPVLKAVRWGAMGYIPLNVHMQQKVYHHPEEHPEYADIVKYWKVLFSDISPEPPKEFVTWCCAQFVVTRATIRARPKAFYQNIYDWVTYSNVTSFISSRVLEQTWHMIFGMPAVAPIIPPCEIFDCDVLDTVTAVVEQWEGTPFDRIPCRVYDVKHLQDPRTRASPTYAPRERVYEAPDAAALAAATAERDKYAAEVDALKERDEELRETGELLAWQKNESLQFGYGKPDPPANIAEPWRPHK